MQKQRIIFLAVGIILGLVAIFMTQAYIKDTVQQEKKKAEKALEKLKEAQAVVMIARQDIPAGVAIQPEMLVAAITLRENVRPQAVTSTDSISGLVTAAPFAKGEQITMAKLSASSAPISVSQRNLSNLTPEGKRAVVTSVENISDLVGLIKPGDYVDVIAVLPVPQEGKEARVVAKQTIVPAFQKVLILAIGQETTPQAATKERIKEKSPPVTLALSPTEANILTFIQEQGKVRLSLRSAKDVRIENERSITWDNISEYLPQLRGAGEGKETIEIYRGLKREKIPISEE